MGRTKVTHEVRARVLDRIRAALAEGDEVAAMRIAQELGRRWKACDKRRARTDACWSGGSRVHPAISQVA